MRVRTILKWKSVHSRLEILCWNWKHYRKFAPITIDGWNNLRIGELQGSTRVVFFGDSPVEKILKFCKILQLSDKISQNFKSFQFFQKYTQTKSANLQKLQSQLWDTESGTLIIISSLHQLSILCNMYLWIQRWLWTESSWYERISPNDRDIVLPLHFYLHIYPFLMALE